MKELSAILGWFKPSPIYLLPVAVTAAVLLFTPIGFRQRLGVADLVATYRGWMFVIFLISSSMTIVIWAYAIGALASKHVKQNALLRRKRERLRHLSPEEKTVLSYYILKRTKSQELPYGTGVVRSLIQSGIIYAASHWGADMMTFTFNIDDWYWAELNKHHEYLEPELSETGIGSK